MKVPISLWGLPSKEQRTQRGEQVTSERRRLAVTTTAKSSKPMPLGDDALWCDVIEMAINIETAKKTPTGKCFMRYLSCLLKTIKVIRYMRSSRNSHSQQAPNETGKLRVMWYSGLILDKKGSHNQTKESQNIGFKNNVSIFVQ